MGIALLRMLPSRPFLMTIAYSFAFAVSSPVGLGIGIAINATTQGRTADWIYAISMGLACGVFIYVAINHLIAKGFRPEKPSYFDTPLFKFFAVLAGVAVMAVVMIWDWFNLLVIVMSLRNKLCISLMKNSYHVCFFCTQTSSHLQILFATGICTNVRYV